MSHHVIVTLADDRPVRVDYREPIVRTLRRIIAELQQPIPKRDHDRLAQDELAAAAWLDKNGHRTCTAAQIRDGTCTAHD